MRFDSSTRRDLMGWLGAVAAAGAVRPSESSATSLPVADQTPALGSADIEAMIHRAVEQLLVREQLAQADQCILSCVDEIVRQAELIAALACEGRDMAGAKAELTRLQQGHAMLLAERKRLLLELRW
jgi:hypothetical protein